jgi:hypothetical protein
MSSTYIAAVWNREEYYYFRSEEAVPLHAMEVLGERGGIAPTHSWPRHWMRVSGQCHSLAMLYPQGRDPGTHWTGGWVGPRTSLDTEARGKILFLCWGSNPNRPAIQSVVRHYADWATPSSLRVKKVYLELIKGDSLLVHLETWFWLIWAEHCDWLVIIPTSY